ncbi:MAG: GT4 family glycosyltransferase PelF [Dehalogenimonas sp.]
MRVCIVSEGSYPVTRGGLSEWAHMLIKSLSSVRFDVFCIVPYDEPQVSVYPKLPNIDRVVIKPILRSRPHFSPRELAPKIRRSLPGVIRQMTDGKAMTLTSLTDSKQRCPASKAWLASESYWDCVTGIYKDSHSEESLTDYFWSVFGFNSILLDSLNFINEMPRADIYHSLSTGFAGYACAIAKLTRNKPMVTTEQGLYLVERRAELTQSDVSPLYRDLGFKFSESLVRTSYQYADRIVPPCYIPHTKIEKDLGADPIKITVINNGIEVERFTPGNRTGEKVVIGCFARVVPIKGITDLIKAAKIVTQRCDAEFVVLGEIQDKNYHQKCLDLIEELGISKSFKIMGHVSAEEWYRKVDIFTLSSISEGVPYALLEAMSSELPSVCTAVGGVPEIMSDGVGFVVPPGEPEALADKLCLLVEDKELRKKLGNHAINVAHQKYTLTEMAGKFLKLYEELAG